ncbi:CDPK-related kinase 4-like [Pyrus ussuriensis x Pyrus communis]|uniref:non-specific serine/threonine protein kinase n=1 Tax=Pyrus ussuriensis x Pyrus communis TaxID=2448454 RepID=A0A5N5F6J3_9ROSA|nr:CDPK-related kinase 4-like [Pyrus ussuriensis x Pyrus communis]
MGLCCSKNVAVSGADNEPTAAHQSKHSPVAPVPPSPRPGDDHSSKHTPANSFSASPCPSPLPAGIAPSPARTPGRKFRWPLPPPSPAKPIMEALRRRQGREAKPKDGPIPEEHQGGEEGEGGERALDKSFGYGKNIGAKFELGKMVGRGHFGHTCWAKGKKGELKGQPVAVKIIAKAKMTTAIAIEDVRREVKILKALAGHKNLVRFYDAFEDAHNVYIVMELCEGGELLDRILSRGGRYTEEDAKTIVVQILSVVSFCHLQGVVHRDLKPENFLFKTRDEDAPLKVIDFGLSDFTRPDQRLNDIVGSAYYVAPEVLHRSYSLEADMWSIGVITYILLCGSRPFWARTESGIFRSVLRADPNFDDSPWPSVSSEAKDFLKRLLNKDHRKRMTAAQALTHPWLRDENRDVPLDILIYKLVKSYVRSSPLKRAALKALSKAITEDELFYLRAQFRLLDPKQGYVSLDNFRTALMRNATDAMKESRVHDFINLMEPLSHKKLDFEEFCVAAISTYQLEAHEGWENIASTAFEYFENEGNRVITVEELAQEMNLLPTSYQLLNDWTRTSDRKLSFLGYTKFLHGVTVRSSNTRHR